MGKLETIKAELDGNVPLYSALTNAEAATELNAVNKPRNRATMSGKEVKDKITVVDWDSRLPDQQNQLLSLFARDDLDPFGIDQHIFVQNMAGSTGDSVAALAVARVETVSQGRIIGVGFVSEGDVFHARSL